MNKLTVCLLSLAATSVQAQNNDNLALALAQPQDSAILASQTDNISPKNAATLLADKKAILVDVREADEWQQQHIPGAINIPLNELPDRIGELAAYKETPVITQCQRGGRSQKAMTVLKSLKFSKVYNMEGGIEAWNKAGLKTE